MLSVEMRTLCRIPHLLVSPKLLRPRYCSSQASSEVIQLLKVPHAKNNIPTSIVQKVDKKLHLKRHHPLNIIKTKIEDYCNKYALDNEQNSFMIYDNLSPIVTTKQCFDDLLVASDHISRSSSDTYYLNDSTLLRTHTSAHQSQFIRSGVDSFLCTGDVYRRDEIDASHYPVFHQMEGVRIFNFKENVSINDAKAIIENDLKNILTGLAKHLFGKDCEMRWRNDYFPFTTPSFELEVKFNDAWLEVLGCGVIHDQVMANCNKTNKYGWAFGLGLERLAMILFSIPDIRLFWSDDERFSNQFKSNDIIKFQPYSKFPLCYKDVSFWLPSEGLHINDVYEGKQYTLISSDHH